jgi:hypothetical protein
MMQLQFCSDAYKGVFMKVVSIMLLMGVAATPCLSDELIDLNTLDLARCCQGLRRFGNDVKGP